MIVQLGNHDARQAVDDHPSVTTIHIPEADAEGLGGYSHEPGAMSVDELRKHHHDALLYRGGITNLPGHEAVLAIVNAWPEHATGKPAWIDVTQANDPKVGDDLQAFLQEFYGVSADMPIDVEDRYHTKYGPPGHGGPVLPPITNLFTNDGRTQQAVNYAGGQVGDTGQATAAAATTLTTGKTYTSNQWAGYRVYATVSGTQMVWGNVISNTAGANSVLTVDRWYNSATPGGAAGTTPSSTATFMLADGGGVSAWFVALSTTNIIPAVTDHSLTGEYTTASGGMIRKIAPYALTSGTSPVTFTLTPVFTANGSDTLPSTFYAIGVFNSMVVSNATLAMKFEALLTSSQTVSANGDQLTVTLTETGS